MKQASREAATSPSVAPSHTQLSSTVLLVLSCGSEWGRAELGHGSNSVLRLQERDQRSGTRLSALCCPWG